MSFTAASAWKSTGIILMTRLVILVASMVGVFLSIGYNPAVALGIISVSLTMTVVIEWDRCGHS